MIRIYFLSAFIVFAGWMPRIHADDDKAKALFEARGYADAAVAMLDSKSPYDVTITVEESIDVKGLIAPVAKIRWRIRMDREGKVAFLAADEKRLATEHALAGRLDQWRSSTSVKQIRDTAVTELRLDGKVIRRKLDSFQAACLREQIPDFVACADAEFLWGVTSVRSAREKRHRIYTMADRIATRQAVRDSEPSVEVSAIIEDERMAETHRWTYDLASLCPTSYEIFQKPVGYDTKKIYQQFFQWERDAHYDRVPVSGRCESPTRLIVTKADGSKDVLFGNRYVDITFKWRKHVDGIDFESGKNKISVAEFEALFD